MSRAQDGVGPGATAAKQLSAPQGPAADRTADYKRTWRERNAAHIREYRTAYDAEHRDEVLAQKREYMRRYDVRKAVERRRAEAKRVSSKKYYEAHKEKHLEYTRQWRARKLAEDPEWFRAARAEYQRRRRAGHREKDNAKLRARRQANPEAARAKQRAYYAKHAEELKARKRAHYQAHREEILARNRAWKEREKLRRLAGLPPRRIHTTTTAERDANTAAANEFFARARSREEIAAFRRGVIPPVAGLQPTPLELVAAFERDSKRARIEHALATDLSYADRMRIAEVRRHLAAEQKVARREARTAVENARLDAIGREVNDRLRHRDPPRRPHHLDPAAPHPMLNPNSTMGLNR